MTIAEIRAAIETIKAAARDPEAAHAYEDELLVNVLKAIAAGHPDPAGIATEALKVRDLDFQR